MCDAEQPGGGQRSEISPVEAVRRGVEEEEFVGANDPAAEPERQWPAEAIARHGARGGKRSEEHTSELQSLMRISYAVFCLKKKKIHQRDNAHYKQSNHNKHCRT